MNTWNQIETQLRSWTPRPPSERIRQELFEGAQPAARLEQRALGEQVSAGLWQWLAPAMAMFVMALTLSSQNGPAFTTLILAPDERISELALQNPDLAAYFPSSGHSGHNGWPVAKFDWTNKNQPLTTETKGWKIWATNALMQ